jgi:hypothetical protein
MNTDLNYRFRESVIGKIVWIGHVRGFEDPVYLRLKREYWKNYGR